MATILVAGQEDAWFVARRAQRVRAYAPHTTVSGVQEGLGEALRVAPGLAGTQARVGLRPYPTDGLPILSAGLGRDRCGDRPRPDRTYLGTV